MSQSAAPSAAPPAARNLVSLAKPYFGLIVLSLTLISIGGVVAMLNMPCGIYPEVAFPRITVIVQTPGLAVKDMEVAVTRPIEEAVSIVLGVSRVRSKSVRGAADLSIDFAPGVDMVQALNDVRARMAEVGSQLPPGSTTIVERQTPSVFPIISFAVTGGRDPSSLHDYAYYDLRPRISRIKDVSYVVVQGGDVREVVVEVDPQKLVAAGLSIAEVADRLGRGHRMKAVGRMDRDMLQYQVLVDSQAADPSELEYRVISQKNGQPILLADLGRVVIGHEDRTMAIRANGKNAVALTVFRRLGGDALRVSGELETVLADAAKSAPPGVTIRPIYDQGLLVRAAIGSVRDAIIIGGCLSVVVLLLFLKSWRATLIASLSIPLSLVISFVFLYLTGDTLNLMSLGGLAVAIGLIIDDTVVVVENIARHLAEGQSGDGAVESASREISGAVVGSTMTTILVFLPLILLSGVVGQFFQSLSIALTVSLLVSMVVSLTVIPVLSARFLARRPMPDSGPIYNRLATSYEGMLRFGLRYPRASLAVALLTIVPGWFLFQQLEQGFMPEMDEGAFVIDYNMPVGSSLAQTDKVVRRMEAVLLGTDDISGYIRRTGAELGLFATESYTGDVLVSLKPLGSRRPTEEIFESLREEFKQTIPELEVELKRLIEDQIDDLAGVQSPIEVKIYGPDIAMLRTLAEEAGKIVEGTPGVVDVNTNVHLGNPDIVVRPDSVQIARVGLTEQELETQLGAALYGQVASTIPEQDRMTKIRVRYADLVRFDNQRLKELPISLSAAAPGANVAGANAAGANNGAAPAGGMGVAPLGQLAAIEVVRSPNEMWRENQQPVITVTAQREGRDLGSVVRDLQARLPEMKFPAGYRWELAGDYLAQREAFASLAMVIVLAAALVFLLLGFQFRSLTLPLLIFLAQPVSLVSALFALWITHTPLNVSSLMGVILLVGLDVKNGLILIEYIGQLRTAGIGLDDALLKAGRTRFRPILMTSLSTIFGLLPLAFGFGPGAQMQKPLAVAVIGGLIANMLLTRLLIPVGYLLLHRAADQSPATVGPVAPAAGIAAPVAPSDANAAGPAATAG